MDWEGLDMKGEVRAVRVSCDSQAAWFEANGRFEIKQLCRLEIKKQ